MLIAWLAVLSGPAKVWAADERSLVPLWLSAQTNLQTWSADVVQTRSLKTLVQPLTAEGHVWFAAPNRFRWEIVTPSPTIAVRQPEQMLVIYPKLKRAERYPLTTEQPGPWKDTLSLLEAGFPRSQSELQARFKVLSESISNAVCEVVLQPRSISARRMMPQIKIAFGTNDFTLRATELQFADGSTMRNDFSNTKLNPQLNESLFTPELGSDFKVVEPMKR
jgi:outer membrane lipoprotein-sorting protein